MVSPPFLLLCFVLGCRPREVPDDTDPGITRPNPEDLYPVATSRWSAMSFFSCAIPVGSSVILMDVGNGIAAHRLDDGAVEWVYQDETTTNTQIATDGTDIAFVDWNDVLHRVEVLTGEARWSVPLPPASECCSGKPLIMDETVFVSSRSGGLHRIDGKTGALEAFVGPDDFSAYHSWMASDGEVIVGGDTRFMAIEIPSGTVRWRAATPSVFSGSGILGGRGSEGPALAGEAVIIEASVSEGAALMALDLRSGEELWRTDRFPYAGTTVHEDMAFAAGRWGELDDPSFMAGVISFNVINGIIRWRFETEDPPYTPPSVDEEYVYINDVSRIWAVDRLSGAVRWITPAVERDNSVLHCPARRAGDALIVNTDGGEVIVYDIPEGH